MFPWSYFAVVLLKNRADFIILIPRRHDAAENSRAVDPSEYVAAYMLGQNALLFSHQSPCLWTISDTVGARIDLQISGS